MGWEEFKAWSETLFKDRQIEECLGYQNQPGTQWNPGLCSGQIHNLEKVFGLEFPDEYKRMLLALDGIDRDQIAIDPDQVEESEFNRQCYQYPDDLDNVRWLITEIAEHIDFVKEALSLEGYEAENVIGFVPLYAHRALAVFKDKSLTPVISIHQGTDVIVDGKSLMEYWKKELST
jgi:cell wall assembly regulator SMI1